VPLFTKHPAETQKLMRNTSVTSLTLQDTTPERIPILLADNNHYGVLAVGRALRAAGYEPWLAVNDARTYAARSRTTAGTVPVPDPSFDGEGFVHQLAAAAVRLSAAAVLPTEDAHLMALAGREEDFAGVVLGAPRRQSVEWATDKELLIKLSETAKLRTPPTIKVFRGDTEAVGAFGFPAVLKPLRSHTRNLDGTVSTRSARCVLAEQAAVAVNDVPDEGALVQPYIPGRLISISGVVWKGELVCALHQISTRIWPVPCGGSAYAETIPPDDELERGVGRLLKSIDWSGLFQAQFIRGAHGEHYLIDLNPRVYGSLTLAVAAGLNLPGIWVDLLLGRRCHVGGYRVGTRFRHEEKDVRALAKMLVDGEHLGALQGCMPRRGTTHAIFSFRDPMPLLVSVGKLIGRP
jgi:predicted ATP-grasp superfamily ATP-dependent carboligase